MTPIRKAVLILLCLAGFVAVSAARSRPLSVEAQIRALRAELNAAIAAHDVAAMRKQYLPNFTILPGSSGLPFDLSAFEKRIGAGFADPTFVTYVRTPTRVTVGATGKRAAESGTWVGTWRKSDGLVRLSGVYQAMWLPTKDGWRLQNESFVSLACTGSKACAEVD